MSLTLQEVFNKAYIGCVVKQKCDPAVRGGICQYLTKDGKRCAIGHNLPDDSPMLRSSGTVLTLSVAYPNEMKALFGDIDVNILRELQQAHDWTSGDMMKQKFREFAIKYNLTVPTV